MKTQDPQDRDRDPRIAFFDRQSITWDRDGRDPVETIRRLNELQNLLGLQPGQDLLEVGCGTGQITGWLADRIRPGKVTAIDFSKSMLSQASQKQLDAALLCRDVCQDDLGREEFDVVLCFHAFPHFRDQSQAVRRLGQSLRKGGRLIVMHLAARAKINAFHDQVGGEVTGDHLPDDPTFRALLRDAGLECIEVIDRDDLFFLSAVRAS